MTKAELKDVVERCVWTAIETATAVLVAAGTGWLEASVWQTAGVTAGAAVLSVIKNVATTKLGNKDA
jgi:hypothetical protein